MDEVKPHRNPMRFNLAGFTLVEMLIVVAIFLMISTAISSTYVKIFNLLSANKLKLLALDVGNEQIELIRNLSFTDVGEVGGIPNGKIPHSRILSRSGIDFTMTTTIRNIDDPFDGQIGSSTKNDLSPSDYRLVEIEIGNSSPNFKPLVLNTLVAPKNLETASTNGALFVKVFDANGNPVVGADVHIVNVATTTTIVIDDVTDNTGRLNIVDVPPGTNAYKITISKPGYSTEQTFAPGAVGNPTPTKPNITVLVQQVSQVSFAIDLLSTLTVTTKNTQCVPVPNVTTTVKGAKLLGTPSVYKYSTTNVTNGSGTYSIPNLEWDIYTLLLNDSTYELVGGNPILPISLSPASTQSVDLIVAPRDPRTLLVTVKDSSTSLPLTDGSVRLTGIGFDSTLTTGRGFVRQTDWSGGSGQTTMGISNQYYSNDGNIDTTTTVGELSLKKVLGTYVASGELVSSIFDMGTTTNYSQILWNPHDQPALTGTSSVRFQIATSDTNTATTTWSFVGPDGTASTYFTLANQTINSAQNNTQYIRYKVYLSTPNSTYTPNISDIMITFTSLCTPPGQVTFSGLSSGTYSVSVSKTGYTTSSFSVDISPSWQSTEVILSP